METRRGGDHVKKQGNIYFKTVDAKEGRLLFAGFGVPAGYQAKDCQI